MSLQIHYRDDDYVVVYKPPGIFVHRTHLARDRDVLLQRVRDQVGQRVDAVHRLDRPTQGLVLFGLHREATRQAATLFAEGTVDKRYLAVVRGFADARGEVARPIDDDGKSKPARTSYRLWAKTQLPLPTKRYDNARFSLLVVKPHTGRRHQIRRHLAAVQRPILGDSIHGDNSINGWGDRHLGDRLLMLCAVGLAFVHPLSGEPLRIACLPASDFQQRLAFLGAQNSLQSGFCAPQPAQVFADEDPGAC